MEHDQKNTYEIHIVSYNNTKILELPKEYERLVITDSQVCLNEVMSFHDLKNKREALKMFKRTVKWFEETKQKKTSSKKYGKSTTMAYNIAAEQERLEILAETYHGLEVNTVQTTSFGQMSQLASMLNFEKIKQVTYIQDRTSLVANQ